jgi:hypothetical protein
MNAGKLQAIPNDIVCGVRLLSDHGCRESLLSEEAFKAGNLLNRGK